jgi:hypothetical protein
MVGELETIVTDTLHRNSLEDGIVLAVVAFKEIPFILSHSSSTPTLHYSILPSLNSPRDLRLHISRSSGQIDVVPSKDLLSCRCP